MSTSDEYMSAAYLRLMEVSAVSAPLSTECTGYGENVRLGFRDVPARVTTGAFILHSGWEKWHGSEEQAQGIHGMASGAFPFMRKVPPTTFLKVLAATEIGIGAALLAPVVPNKVAGASLTAFAGSLVAMYLRTPALHKPNSVWPTPAGIGVSKDVWMLGIGLGLLADSAKGGDDT